MTTYKQLAKEHLVATNRKAGTEFAEIPKSEWPIASDITKAQPVKAWRNNRFLVVLYDDRGRDRISVNKTTVKGFGKKNDPIWDDQITWDELQQIKNAIGFADKWAVECYPPIDRVVNVANMRHLWLLSIDPEFGWQA